MNTIRIYKTSKPIYVCWDSGLDDVEVAAVKIAITEIKQLYLKSQIYDYGSNKWSVGDYSSADWYIEKATKRGKQYSAMSILQMLNAEPWQKDNRHIDIFITSKDLYAEGCSYVFGQAVFEWGVAVQSTYRFKSAGLDDKSRTACIRRLVLHELGHLLGIAKPGRQFTVESLGSHCSNIPCVMHQGMSVREWESLSIMELDKHQTYCQDCMSELRDH